MKHSYSFHRFSLLAILLCGALLLSSGLALGKEFVIGFQTDRSGPTQTIGPFLGDGAADYTKLYNKRGGLGDGHTIRLMEIEHGYNVPRSLESYERHKAAGALTIAIFGTPHTKALTPKLVRDKILGTSAGFGSADAANGKKFPYLFPVASSYWSQFGTAMQFVQDKSEGKKVKVAYLYYDNPAGREPLAILKDLEKKLDIKVPTYAVPPPGLEMRPQVLGIGRKYRADWVITHLFGRAPGVSIKEFRRIGIKPNRLVSLAWGTAESDVRVAGEKESTGYYGVQFTGVGEDFDVHRAIKAMYKEEGKASPKSMKTSVYYNRGVFTAALHIKAIEKAYKKHGVKVTSVQVKDAMETINSDDLKELSGFLPPLNITPEDHEGGGWARVYQWKTNHWEAASDWMQGHRDVVLKRLAAE